MQKKRHKKRMKDKKVEKIKAEKMLDENRTNDRSVMHAQCGYAFRSRTQSAREKIYNSLWRRRHDERRIKTE